MVNEQVDKVKNIKKKQLLSTNKRTIHNRIPVSITYYGYLPNISNIITKNWRILQISPAFQKVFHEKPMMTNKRSKNLSELIGDHTLQGRKVFKTQFQIINGESKSYSTTNKSYLCCAQVINTKTF